MLSSQDWISENRQPGFASQGFFNSELEASPRGDELGLMSIILESVTQSLVDDIRKLGKSYGQLDLIEEKVPDDLKPLARELFGAIKKDKILWSRLSI